MEKNGALSEGELGFTFFQSILPLQSMIFIGLKQNKMKDFVFVLVVV